MRHPSTEATPGDWSVFAWFFQDFSGDDFCRKFFGNEP